MKLSDVKNDRTIDVIAAIIGPIAKIADDKEATAFLQKEKPPKGVDAKKFATQRVVDCVPTLLTRHKAEIIQILAAIEGVSSEEYAASLNLVKLCRDCVDLLTDKEFVSLFTSAQSNRV